MRTTLWRNLWETYPEVDGVVYNAVIKALVTRCKLKCDNHNITNIYNKWYWLNCVKDTGCFVLLFIF